MIFKLLSVEKTDVHNFEALSRKCYELKRGNYAFKILMRPEHNNISCVKGIFQHSTKLRDTVIDTWDGTSSDSGGGILFANYRIII